MSKPNIDELLWFSFHINVLNVTKIFCLNQQLKSVAHLPWKAFMYKVRPHSPTDLSQYRNSLLLIFISCQAFNTFIDDVFAFIITMPTSHRLACFRDDVVFLIYLYQRWYTPTPHTHQKHTEALLTPCSLHHPTRLYPVDKTRVNEYGVSYDEKPKRKPHKD